MRNFITFIAIYSRLWIPSSGRVVPYLASSVELTDERHTYTEFRYATLNTFVDTDWDDLPPVKAATHREAHAVTDCIAHLKIKFLGYMGIRTACLYKGASWAHTFNGIIEVEGRSFTKEEFIDRTRPVTGFVAREMSSLVKGYLIDGNFYGTIRMYDAHRTYHVHYYFEPITALHTYSLYPINKTASDHNALIFEYVGHDADVEKLRPPEDIAKEQYEKEVYETAGVILTEGGRVGFDANETKIKREAESSGKHPASLADHQQNDAVLSSGAKRRKEAADSLLMKSTPDNVVVAYHDDVAGIIPLIRGVSTSDILDTSTGKSTLCSLCVWIEPLFAKMFGYGRAPEYGLGEIAEMIKRLDWLFRAMDFNADNSAEDFGFVLKTIIVSNEFNVQNHIKPRTRRDAAEKKSATEHPTTNHTTSGASPSHASRKKSQVKGKVIYRALLNQLKKNPKLSECCGIVGFVYLDLSPVLSISTIRGLCSKDNLMMLSGMLHGHKVGIFDVQRSTIHALGHMLGAKHDRTMRAECQDTKPSTFYNPFVMHPVPQANVGLRGNSFRMSACSKLEIVTFLESNNLNKCLYNDKDDFCGNGMIDPGEDCDCGSLWQCHFKECCGESDTIFGCKRTELDKKKVCVRPKKW